MVTSYGVLNVCVACSTVIPLEIWDCPGSTTPESLGTPFSEFAVIVFVIDISVRRTFFTVSRLLCLSYFCAQNTMYQQAIKQLVDFAIAAYEESPETAFEVFVHKVDVYSDDYKIGKPIHFWSRAAVCAVSPAFFASFGSTLRIRLGDNDCAL